MQPCLACQASDYWSKSSHQSHEQIEVQAAHHREPHLRKSSSLSMQWKRKCNSVGRRVPARGSDFHSYQISAGRQPLKLP